MDQSRGGRHAVKISGEDGDPPARRRPRKVWSWLCCMSIDSAVDSISTRNILDKAPPDSSASSVDADLSPTGLDSRFVDPRERDLPPAWGHKFGSHRSDYSLNSVGSGWRQHEPGRALSVITEATERDEQLTARSGYTAAFQQSNRMTSARDNSRLSTPRSTREIDKSRAGGRRGSTGDVSPRSDFSGPHGSPSSSGHDKLTSASIVPGNAGPQRSGHSGLTLRKQAQPQRQKRRPASVSDASSALSGSLPIAGSLMSATMMLEDDDLGPGGSSKIVGDRANRARSGSSDSGHSSGSSVASFDGPETNVGGHLTQHGGFLLTAFSGINDHDEDDAAVRSVPSKAASPVHAASNGIRSPNAVVGSHGSVVVPPLQLRGSGSPVLAHGNAQQGVAAATSATVTVQQTIQPAHHQQRIVSDRHDDLTVVNPMFAGVIR